MNKYIDAREVWPFHKNPLITNEGFRSAVEGQKLIYEKELQGKRIALEPCKILLDWHLENVSRTSRGDRLTSLISFAAVCGLIIDHYKEDLVMYHE